MTSLMHSQKPYERLRVLRKLGGLCLIDHLTRFQYIGTIGDRQRAVEILLDQEDREPLLLEAGAGVVSARNWPLLRQVTQSTSDVASTRQDAMRR